VLQSTPRAEREHEPVTERCRRRKRRLRLRTERRARPTPNLAVGATQVVQWVNESFAVFDKATGRADQRPGGRQFPVPDTGRGLARPTTTATPIAQYDKAAGPLDPDAVLGVHDALICSA